MRTFKRWFGAGAIVLVALALIACPAVVNEPPTAYPISDVTLDIGGTKSLTLSEYFTDPEGKELTYGSKSSNATVATVSKPNATSVITVTAKAAGTATITVTATDEKDASTSRSFTVTVNEPEPPPEDRAPVGKTILPVSLDIGGTDTVNLSLYFTDPDGDALTYTARSMNQAVATADLDGSVVTITAVAAGKAKIMVSASDGRNAPVPGEISVTVAANKPPVKTTISPVSLEIGETSSVTLSDHFTDPDGDALTYTARSMNQAVATVEEPDAASMITITAVAAGNATISVTASDGVNTVGQSFQVTVNKAQENRSPVLRRILGSTTMERGTKQTISLSDVFIDPDGDDLAFTAKSDDPEIATVSQTNSAVELDAKAVGTTKITFTATDNKSAPVEASFNLTVSVAGNEPPNQDLITPKILRVEDTQEIDLKGYYSDPNGDELTYTDPASSNDAVATASLEGSVVTITGMAMGSARITVGATDGNSQPRTQTFDVTVKAKFNHPPTEKPGSIKDVRLKLRSKTSENVRLANYFEDAEGDTLTYTAVSNGPETATVSEPDSDSMITVTAVAAGYTTIMVTASDGASNDVNMESATPDMQANAPASLVLNVTVEAADNRAPVASDIDSVELEINQTHTETLSGYFSDPDGDDLTYDATSSDSEIAMVSEPDSDSMITITAVATGNATIRVTASDGVNTTPAEIMVTVKANKAPVSIGFPSLTLDIGGTDAYKLSDHFTDLDGDELAFTAESSDPTKVSISGVDAQGMVTDPDTTVTITAVAFGEATITFTATDGKVETPTRESFNVTVEASDNERPTQELIGAQVLRVGDAPKMKLSDYYTDPDGDDLTYAASSDMSDVVMADVANGELVLTARAEGSAKVTVSATDGKSQPRQQKFDVTVKAKLNKAPVVKPGVSLDVNLVAGESSDPLDLDEYFEDYENDTLTYGAPSSNKEEVAKVSASDTDASMITIKAVSVGNATVTVTADDGMSNDGVANADAVLELNVRVRAVANMPPVGTAIPKKIVKLVVDEATMTESVTADNTIDLSEYFSDPDSGPQALSYSDDSDMTAIEGSTLTISADAGDVNSTTTITVTASDGEHEATATFDVIVAPPDDPARTNEIAGQHFEHDDRDAREFTLSNHFSGATDYDVVSNNKKVVKADEEDGTLTLTPIGPGNTSVTVAATNSAGRSREWVIEVSIDAVPVPTHTPKPPQVAPVVLDDGPDTITLSEYFSGATDYDVGSSNPAVLTVGEEDGVLTLTPHKTGSAIVTVTPRNSGGTGTPRFFTVAVQAKPGLESDMMFDKKRLRVTLDTASGSGDVSAGVKRFELNTFVKDPDGDDTKLKFSTKTSDSKIVAVYPTPMTTGNDPTVDYPALVDGDKKTTTDKDDVTIRGRKLGTATIEVTATDEQGLKQTWMFTVTVASAANTGPSVDNSVTFPGEETTGTYAEFVKIKDIGRFKSTDTAAKKLKIDLGAIFNDTDVETPGRSSEDSWTFKATSTDEKVVKVSLESTNNREKLDEYNVVVTPVGSGKAYVYFEVTDSYGESAGGKLTTGDAPRLTANTFFEVKVNSPPKPYNGDGDKRRSLSTERRLMELIARDAASDVDFTDAAAGYDYTITDGAIRLVDDDWSDATMKGYFSDKDNDSLKCRINVAGDTVLVTLGNEKDSITVDPNGAETDLTKLKTGRTTVAVTCYDQVDGSNFESAKDTLTLNVSSQQSIR